MLAKLFERSEFFVSAEKCRRLAIEDTKCGFPISLKSYHLGKLEQIKLQTLGICGNEQSPSYK